MSVKALPTAGFHRVRGSENLRACVHLYNATSFNAVALPVVCALDRNIHPLDLNESWTSLCVVSTFNQETPVHGRQHIRTPHPPTHGMISV